MTSYPLIADTSTVLGLHARTILLGVYGIFLIVGGVIGYIKAKSMPSLIAGGVSGVLALILAVIAPIWIYTPYLALLLSLVLTIIMLKRYLSTKKPFPSLAIVVFSLVVAGSQVYLLVRPAAHH
jgi:uncharacterized membrane protein (UPF0136 family)